MRFSQRYGYTPVRNVIQHESMDDELRNSLWNALHECYLGPGLTLAMSSKLWTDFFKWPITFDRLELCISPIQERTTKKIREYFFNSQWHEVYDLVEFIADVDTSARRANEFRHLMNSYLEREVSAYRFVDECITPITDQREIDEVETALNGKSDAVSKQLARAVELLSDRQNPDYRNSVKESISAVEGEVRSTLRTDGGTLGELLRQLEQREPLHPALKAAFSSLYGYTSDESGIRHALLDNGREVTFEEAKFMLVACSAFINYVRGATKSY